MVEKIVTLSWKDGNAENKAIELIVDGERIDIPKVYDHEDNPYDMRRSLERFAYRIGFTSTTPVERQLKHDEIHDLAERLRDNWPEIDDILGITDEIKEREEEDEKNSPPGYRVAKCCEYCKFFVKNKKGDAYASHCESPAGKFSGVSEQCICILFEYGNENAVDLMMQLCVTKPRRMS